MHLLSSALILLLAVSSSHAAPTAAPSDEEWPTTIETIYENVTRTVIHYVTDAPEIQKDLEGSGLETETKPVEETISFNERLDKAARKHEQANRLLQSMTATEEAPAADTVITTTRMCTCVEATDCRKESEGQMDQCMEGCYDHMEGYGDKTETYLQCFSKNNASIVEAENCLFEETSNRRKTERSTLRFSPSSTAPSIACTRNSMPALRLRDVESKCLPSTSFSTKLRECTKKNWKINNSLILACQCLAWKNGVKDLQGTCVTLGNAYFVDRA